jgi:tetratricopeptide (TPR) repeat protein
LISYQLRIVIKKNKLDEFIESLLSMVGDFRKEEDAFKKAGEEIDKGNNDLAKSIEEYDKGNDRRAEEYLDKAANCYDKAMDIIS